MTARKRSADSQGTWSEVLGIFTRLGLTSFGGPIAHIGYFREEFVNRRKWFDDRTYADLVALCQFLPGPASSQVGIAIGLSRAGLPGALAAWFGFTLPSAIAMVLFAYGVIHFGTDLGSGWLQGLKVVAVAVVAQALHGMAQTLAPDKERATLAVAAAVLVILWPAAGGQVAAIVLGGLIGWFTLESKVNRDSTGTGMRVDVSRVLALGCLAVFFALLIGLPLLVAAGAPQAVQYVDSFYRAGALVFGGGHVVLPLLQAEVVAPGWVDTDTVLAGYGAAQAVPGPLFTFAAYLGTMLGPAPTGVIGALICLVAIFLPSFLLIIGALPYWNGLRTRVWIQSALLGVNAAVVGLMLAALYDPVWTSGILTPADFALGIVLFIMLTMWKVPPWIVVIIAAIAGAAIATA